MVSKRAKRKTVPKPVATRVSLYLRHLERLAAEGMRTVSSQQLGQAVGQAAARVRKDLAFFGHFGHRGVGYPVESLAKSLRRILGTHKVWPAALVGVGNLGTALLCYRGFAERGFSIVLAFDRDHRKVGRRIADLQVRPVKIFEKLVRQEDIALGLIAVNAADAQQVADMMVKANIKGILNFAPVEILVPDEVVVSSVDMAVLLEQITYRLERDAAERT